MGSVCHLKSRVLKQSHVLLSVSLSPSSLSVVKWVSPGVCVCGVSVRPGIHLKMAVPHGVGMFK